MIYLCCALTVVLELAFFAFTPYRRRRYFMLLCGAVNVATNLSLNLILRGQGTPAVIVLPEALVVLAEYGIYAAAYERSLRLLTFTFGANLLSFLAGLLLFEL